MNHNETLKSLEAISLSYFSNKAKKAKVNAKAAAKVYVEARPPKIKSFDAM